MKSNEWALDYAISSGRMTLTSKNSERYLKSLKSSTIKLCKFISQLSQIDSIISILNFLCHSIDHRIQFLFVKWIEEQMKVEEIRIAFETSYAERYEIIRKTDEAMQNLFKIGKENIE